MKRGVGEREIFSKFYNDIAETGETGGGDYFSKEELLRATGRGGRRRDKIHRDVMAFDEVLPCRPVVWAGLRLYC